MELSDEQRKLLAAMGKVGGKKSAERRLPKSKKKRAKAMSELSKKRWDKEKS
jgi:hypothetical protein